MLGRDQVRRSAALQAGVDVGQDGTSGVCVGEKGVRHSASHNAM